MALFPSARPNAYNLVFRFPDRHLWTLRSVSRVSVALLKGLLCCGGCAMGSYFGVVEAFMTSREDGTVRRTDRGEHWPTTVAWLAVGAAFFALWFWLLPSWLGFHVDTAGGARLRWIAGVPSVL